MLIILLIAAVVILSGLGLLIFVGMHSGRGDLIAPPADFGPEANARPELPRIEPEPISLPPAQERPELVPTLPPDPATQKPAPSPFEELSQQFDSRTGDDPPPETTPKRGPRSGEKRPPRPSDAETLWQETPKPAGTPPGKIEGAYSKEELVDREVHAMLIQGRRDRAIKYVRREMQLDTAHAETYVALLADRFRL